MWFIPKYLTNEFTQIFKISLITDNISISFHLIGVRHDPNMKYELQPLKPKKFYHRIHRPSHFLNFTSIEENELTLTDRDNPLA